MQFLAIELDALLLSIKMRNVCRILKVIISIKAKLKYTRYNKNTYWAQIAQINDRQGLQRY